MTVILGRWWRRHGTRVLEVTVSLVLAAAIWRLGNELPRLIWGSEGGVDLRLRHEEVRLWFAGWPLYTEAARGDYPPASYAILWPLLGWLPAGLARWFWAATAIGGLAWLGALSAAQSNATTWRERLLIFLIPFATYSASAAINVGQLINHVLPLVVAGLLLVARSRGTWREDLAATALLLPALVKPTLSAPFFWFVCFVPRRMRPIALVSVGYVLLTVFAASFQSGDLTTTLFGWLAEGPQPLQGHANVNKLLALVGLREWMLPVSVGLLVGLGVWVFRYRHADHWLLLGVIALVGRFFIHHRLYDDLLVFVPMVTLFRIAKRPTADGTGVMAGLLFACMLGSVLAPAQFLGGRTLWSVAMELGQVVVWSGTLVFLVVRVQREREAAPAISVARAESEVAR